MSGETAAGQYWLAVLKEDMLLAVKPKAVEHSFRAYESLRKQVERQAVKTSNGRAVRAKAEH